MNSNKFLMCLFCCIGLALFYTGCSNDGTSGGNTENGGSDKLQIEITYPVQSNPTTFGKIKPNYGNSNTRQIAYVIYNVENHLAAIQIDYQMAGNVTVGQNFDVLTQFDSHCRFNGQYRAFAYDKNDPDILSNIVDFEIRIPSNYNIPNMNAQTCLPTSAANRTYKMEYVYSFGYNFWHEGDYETEINTAFTSSKVTLSNPANTNANPYNRREIGTLYYDVPSNHSSPATWVYENVGMVNYYEPAKYHGFVMSVKDITGWGTDGGATYSPGKTLNRTDQGQRFSFILNGRIEQNTTLARKPKTQAITFIHEVGHQMLMGVHQFNYGPYEAPEANYYHLNLSSDGGDCCAMTPNINYTCSGDFFFNFCNLHRCHIYNAKWDKNPTN